MVLSLVPLLASCCSTGYVTAVGWSIPSVCWPTCLPRVGALAHLLASRWSTGSTSLDVPQARRVC